MIEGDEPFVIHPGEFALGRTQEYVEIPDDIVARIEGKSSLGRLGLIVHATAGLRRPGLQGHADARDHQPHARPDQALRRPADRPALVHGARRAGRAAVRVARAGLALPGPDGRDGVPLRARRPVAFPPMLATFLTFAAEAVEEEEPSQDARSTSWAVAAGLLGGRCCSRSACARRRSPARAGAAARRDRRSASCWSLAAMASAVITASSPDARRRCHDAGMGTEEQSTNGGGVATRLRHADRHRQPDGQDVRDPDRGRHDPRARACARSRSTRTTSA